MKPILFLAGAVSAFSLASAALAQTPDGAPALQLAPVPAPTSTPSPAAMEHARHLIQMMHMDRMMDQMMDAIKSAMRQSIARQMPSGQQEQAAGIQDAMWDEMRPVMSRMMDGMPALYASNFTDQELEEIDRFYSSPVGQSVIAKMPHIMQAMMQTEMPKIMAEMPGVMERAFNRYCDKASCTPEVRAALMKSVEAMKAKQAGGGTP